MTPDSARLVVVGAGTMGRQIAAIFAQASARVTVVEASEAVRASARQWLDDFLGTDAADMVEVVPDATAQLAEADLVVEAVPEDLEIKRQVFRWLSAAAPSAILASNSSSLPVAWLGDAVADHSRLLNVHFYVRPWERRVVEIMTSGSSSETAIASVQQLLAAAGMTTFVLRVLSVGLLYNRIWAAIKREALAIVDEGVATARDVDQIVKLLDPQPARGPFERMDDVGLDTVQAIEKVYADLFELPPSAVLAAMVESGRLGRKTSAGFYDY